MKFNIAGLQPSHSIGTTRKHGQAQKLAAAEATQKLAAAEGTTEAAQAEAQPKPAAADKAAKKAKAKAEARAAAAAKAEALAAEKAERRKRREKRRAAKAKEKACPGKRCLLQGLEVDCISAYPNTGSLATSHRRDRRILNPNQS